MTHRPVPPSTTLLGLIAALALAASTGFACPDVDRSGAVDIDDVIAVVLEWGTDGAGSRADVDGSGLIDVDDLLAVVVAWGPLEAPCDPPVDEDAPEIEIWYGPHQTFGEPGRSQEQINVLGNVHAPHGLRSLVYSLDGGPELPLSIGPDQRRLAFAGDFNVELFYEDMPTGLSELRIRAADELGRETIEIVTVDVRPDHEWSLPYTIDWSEVEHPGNVVDIVDGRWSLDRGGLRCNVPEYDRLVTFGDVAWQDYELTVPVTVHEIDPGGYEWPSLVPAVGVIFRWTGHTDHFDPNAQPNVGWWPLGAAFQYVFRTTQCGDRYELYGNPYVLIDEDAGCTLPMELGSTHMWKMKVNSVPAGHRYKFKAWPAGEPEPTGWLFNVLEDASQPGFGSIGLLAHHVDVTFGDVSVVPLD